MNLQVSIQSVFALEYSELWISCAVQEARWGSAKVSIVAAGIEASEAMIISDASKGQLSLLWHKLYSVCMLLKACSCKSKHCPADHDLDLGQNALFGDNALLASSARLA